MGAEELALALTGNGLQRMTARVLSALLFTERETITAGDIAEELGTGAGSVSTALKSLLGVGLAEQVPAPGDRRSHYRCPDQAWARLLSSQNVALQAMLTAARQGIADTEPGSPARHRLENLRDFYGYLLRELPAVIDRWPGSVDRQGKKDQR